MAITPIHSKDIQKKKHLAFPDEVIDAFNDLIIESWDGTKSIVKREEVIKLIFIKQKVSDTDTRRKNLLTHRYLDIEDIYETFGWYVEYEQPSWGEDFEPYFIFKKRPINNV